MARRKEENQIQDRICILLRERSCCCIIVSIAIICFMPYLFTRTAFCDNLVFAETGQIGDTIGGITAPFIGIINIILLVFTLRAQLCFNMNQANDNTVSQILNLQSEIIQMDERITFSYTNEKGAVSKSNGVESISLLQWGNDGYPKVTLREMNYLLRQIETFIRLCNCYSSLVGKMKQKDEALSSFTEPYKKLLTAFFDEIEEDKIRPTPSPGDSFSVEEFPSEIELMKRRAKKLQSMLR